METISISSIILAGRTVPADLKKAGKIRAFGMSTKTVPGGKLALEKSDVAMIMYNPISIDEFPIIEKAMKL